MAVTTAVGQLAHVSGIYTPPTHHQEGLNTNMLTHFQNHSGPA
jgi:hypothetical protein